LRERLRFSEEAIDLLLAGGVGFLGALVNLAFLHGTDLFMRLLLRNVGDPALVARLVPRWERLLAPTFGGLIAGFVLTYGLRLIGKQRPGNLLEAVAVGDGRLPFRSSLVKALSSLLSIATGGSLGREGAITQLTAMLASKLGQLVRWPPYRLRMLAACGAAAGIAAPYNAPISGAVFASLIVLGNFSMTVFAPLVLASVVACVVSRSLFGIHATYSAPDFEFTHLAQLPLFLVVGILSGALGAGFLKLLHTTTALFERLPFPLHLRMALGGLVVGTIALFYPEVWGNGAVAANQILGGLPSNRILLLLLGLLAAKLVATLATVGSGAVGGVFTPTLFLGTALGSLCGELAHLAGLALPVPTPAFALVGMGSVLAATTHSPLLAMILVFEISLNYSLMPALMIGCVLSSLVARRLHPFSIYTETARLRQIAQDRENPIPATATDQTVGEFMREPIPPLPETATLREIADRFLSSTNNFLPVVNRDQRLIGMLALHDLKEFLGAGDELRAIIAYDVMRPPPPCLTPSQSLTDALDTVLKSEHQNIPVVSSLPEMRLVGSLPRAEVLATFSEIISRAHPSHL
jgi:CIC family chloride channel protein